MRIRKLAFLASTVLLTGSFALAQIATSDAQAENAKKLKETDEAIIRILDQTIGEIPSLRLPGNRAIVFAMSGDLYWKFDQTRSRELFRNAAAELVTLNAEAEKSEQENEFGGYVEVADPRMEILRLVGARDAELALELMAQTRSAELIEGMAKAAQQAANPDVATTFDRNTSMGRVELMLEQQLAVQAARSDPEKAAKLLKEMLAKGVSIAVVGLLQQIHQQDEKKASELAGDVVSKITGTDLTKNSADLTGAINFLQFVARPPGKENPNVKIFKFTDFQAREIANKLANTFLQPSSSASLMSAMSRAMPSLEKLVPEKTALLKQRQAQYKKSVPVEQGNRQAARRQWDPNATPEEIIAAAGRLANPRDRAAAYQTAANKIGQITDEERAKRLIGQIPDEKIRKGALDRLEVARVMRTGAAGNLDEARRLIASLNNRKTQIQRLVSLAIQYQRKALAKDTETAKGLMAEARAMTNPFPDDEDELADLMEVVKGYAEVDPDTAFRMTEPMVDEFNAVVQATAVLSKYNKRDRSFKKGEMVMRMNGGPGGLLVFRYIPQFQQLGRADLERMILLLDRFQRSDTRTIIKLYVLQAYVRNPPRPAPAM